MKKNRIIKEIEQRYTQYSASDSDTMLYYNTRDFLNYLRSYKVVDQILEDLKKTNPFTEETFIKHQQIEYFAYLDEIADNREKYVAYVLQYLEWGIEETKFDKLRLYDETCWTCSNNKKYSEKERIKLFYIEIVYAIVSYVVETLQKGINVCYVLHQFGERAMRFRCLSNLVDENDLQNRLGLYLYDCGFEFYREENSGNGKPDFLIADDEQFVVEVKLVKIGDNKTRANFEEWTSQLNDYMKKYSSRYGVLYIVSEDDSEYLWKEKFDNKSVMNIYIGDLSPSKRDTIKIECQPEAHSESGLSYHQAFSILSHFIGYSFPYKTRQKAYRTPWFGLKC